MTAPVKHPHGYDLSDGYASFYLERLRRTLERRRDAPWLAPWRLSCLDHAIVADLLMAVEQGRGDEARGLVATYALLPRLRGEGRP